MSSGGRATTRRRRTVPGLTVCRLCVGETLGSSDPLPGGQLARVEGIAATGDAGLTLVDCLDACERGDVVVVRPAPAVRAEHAPVWFERLAGDASSESLHRWVRAGGPGRSPLPEDLAPLRIDAP
ncbi:hypothetical protein [Oerskovia sp. KBS0722]|uniref:hypothetical protein n=1 Tax=Oerskovia sp. KBS0722 TaxID=1179673 RepID=UPI00110D6DB9|nr:hypothetical protein [Oerskovia sp. KBS0722]QDW61550.1 hypothetical protein FFI11_002560 [Oerskovia sp. KBS0722]